MPEGISAFCYRQSLFEDEHSIKGQVDRFLHADFDNLEVRESVLEYFVGTVYLYKEGLSVTSWYSEGTGEVLMEMMGRQKTLLLKRRLSSLIASLLVLPASMQRKSMFSPIDCEKRAVYE